jgi:hypothetical protein
MKGRDHLKDLGVDGDIKMDLREIRLEGMDWIHLAQNRGWWLALVNTIMNFWVPREFLTS